MRLGNPKVGVWGNSKSQLLTIVALIWSIQVIKEAQVHSTSALGDITTSTRMPRKAGWEASFAILTIGSEHTKNGAITASERCAVLSREDSLETWRGAIFKRYYPPLFVSCFHCFIRFSGSMDWQMKEINFTRHGGSRFIELFQSTFTVHSSFSSWGWGRNLDINTGRLDL